MIAWLASAVSDPVGGLAANGIMGLVAMLTIIGCRWVVGQITAAHGRELESAQRERDRAIADRDAALGRLDTQTRFVQEQVVPLFTRATELTKAQLEQLHQAGRHA